MPIYEYICKNCNITIEKIEKINEKNIQICEICKKNLEKKISKTSFSLKGTGWYKTDYKNKDKQ